MSRFALVALWLVTLVGLANCASSVSAGGQRFDVARTGRTVQVLEPAQLASLRALHLGPVVVEGVDEGTAATLAAIVRQVLVEECGAVLPIVDGAGEGIGTIRVRVTGVSRTSGTGPLVVGGLDLEGARLTAVVLPDTGDPPLAFVSETLPSEPDPPSMGRWGRVEGALVAWARELATRLPGGP